jgi:predicted Zn-dependent peptidase
LLTVTAAFSGSLGAQTEQPPAPAAPKAFRIPAHRTFSMPNGMQVTLVHYGTVPKAVVTLEMHTGLIDEPAFGAGLASLTLDMLLEGTVARTSQGISRQAADMGGTIGVSYGAVTSSIGGEVLSEYTGAYMDLLSDVVRHPDLSLSAFERVRQNHLRDLAITMQNAGDQARQRWREMIFPGHSFGRPYSFEGTLKTLQLGHVRNFLDDNFGATRAHLYVSGVFDDARVERAIRNAFTDWTPGIPSTPHVPAPVSERQIDIANRAGAVQSTIWVGLPVIDPSNPDFVKFEVANALLGGAFGSRITSNIREDKGYTYSPYSTIWRHEGASYWVEVADVTTKDTGASLKEIFKEIDKLRHDAPPSAELDGIKQNIVGLFTIENSSRSGIVGQLEYIDEHKLGETFLTDYVRNVMAVSPDDVRRSAQAQLNPDKMTIAVVGDRKIIDSQLLQFQKMVP